MQASDLPVRFQKTFGQDAGPSYIRQVPVNSQIGITDGAASLTDGFPPLNFVPVTAGGVPPFGQDFNGILNQISAWAQWQGAGAPAPWDSTFSTAIGGYPAGSVVQAAVGVGNYWLSTADDNTTNPDSGGAGWIFFSRPPARYSFDLGSPPGSPLSLNVGDQVNMTFSSVTQVPMHIATTQGIYRATVVLLRSTTGVPDPQWRPNDALASNSFSTWIILSVNQNLTSFGSASAFAGFTNSTQSPPIGNIPYNTYSYQNLPAFLMDLFFNTTPDAVNARAPILIEIVFSTYTTSKMMKYHAGLSGGPSIGFGLWNDTTTAWNSLGTLTDVNGGTLNGSAVIKREA